MGALSCCFQDCWVTAKLTISKYLEAPRQIYSYSAFFMSFELTTGWNKCEKNHVLEHFWKAHLCMLCFYGDFYRDGFASVLYHKIFWVTEHVLFIKQDYWGNCVFPSCSQSEVCIHDWYQKFFYLEFLLSASVLRTCWMFNFVW